MVVQTLGGAAGGRRRAAPAPRRARRRPARTQPRCPSPASPSIPAEPSEPESAARELQRDRRRRRGGRGTGDGGAAEGERHPAGASDRHARSLWPRARPRDRALVSRSATEPGSGLAEGRWDTAFEVAPHRGAASDALRRCAHRSGWPRCSRAASRSMPASRSCCAPAPTSTRASLGRGCASASRRPRGAARGAARTKPAPTRRRTSHSSRRAGKPPRGAADQALAGATVTTGNGQPRDRRDAPGSASGCFGADQVLQDG